MSDLVVQTRDGRVRFQVKVKPRASRSAVLGVRDGVLEVAVAAPPVDGAANAELVRTLAAALGVAKSALEIVSGASGKNKLVAVRGLEEADVRSRW